MTLAHSSVLVAGGTGFIGSVLCDRLEAEGCSVTVLTRMPRGWTDTRHEMDPRRRYVSWAPQDPASAAVVLSRELEQVSAVVNLAGEPVVSGRWTEPVKRRILESRVHATRALVGAMEKAGKRPDVLINASAVGYYGARVDSMAKEDAPAGSGFLAEVCRQWEAEASKAQALGCRVVRLRIGLVLGAGGGALRRMLPPFRLGLGGPLGSGDQPMSWIHVDDLVGMMLWLMETPSASGAFNGTAPAPASNGEFSRTLARVLGRPCVFTVPAFVLRLGLGEMSTLLLDGQNAPPKAATAQGFKFRFPEIEGALRNILSS